MNDKEPQFEIEVLYGRAEINSWFKKVDGVYVGMGSSTIYDKDGNIVKHTCKETGINFYLEPEEPKPSFSFLWAFLSVLMVSCLAAVIFIKLTGGIQ